MRVHLGLLACAGILTSCASPEQSGTADETTTGGTTTASSSSANPDSDSDSGPDSDSDAGSDSDSDADSSDSTTGDEPLDPEHAFLQRLPGLWTAPVTSSTSAGSFGIMSMDIRSVDGRVLFSRVDLDSDNSLRFAFAREAHDGNDVLVFRNGGEFKGLLRDTRTALHEVDAEAGTFRFCAIAGGCGYVDALFTFTDDDRLDLDVDVLGMMHIHWGAQRTETRELPEPFPSDDTPLPGDAPFLEMPQLRTTVQWSTPLSEPTDVWIILSTTACGFAPGSCTPSRFLKTRAEAGTTSAELTLEQLHPGTYRLNAMLDRNGNLAGTLFPDTGDGIAVPNAEIEVAPEGESEATATIVLDL
jgi:hypothetical protein